MRAQIFASIAAVAALACSERPPASHAFAQGSGGSSGASAGDRGGLGPSFSAGAYGSTASGSGPGCAEAAELVYVLSTGNQLYSFEPDRKAFTLVGTLRCGVPAGALPNSMAVDRSATAWVNYVASDGLGNDTAGWIYEVSTRDASCAPAPTVTLPASWYRLGMGYATDVANGSAETLYVTGTGASGPDGSPGLGRIDFTSNSLAQVAGFSGDAALAGQRAELTGTGDARLFGFFTTSPVRVAQIDKATAAILSDMPVSGVAAPRAWAFSFWGGAFYLYTSDGTQSSTVTRFDPTTRTVDGTYDLTAPAVIDGAGVSTCAPLVPTK